MGFRALRSSIVVALFAVLFVAAAGSARAQSGVPGWGGGGSCQRAPGDEATPRVVIVKPTPFEYRVWIWIAARFQSTVASTRLADYSRPVLSPLHRTTVAR